MLMISRKNLFGRTLLIQRVDMGQYASPEEVKMTKGTRLAGPVKRKGLMDELILLLALVILLIKRLK